MYIYNITVKEIEESKSAYKLALRIQVEVHECLKALMQCRNPWFLLSEPLKIMVQSTQALYCPHLQR